MTDVPHAPRITKLFSSRRLPLDVFSSSDVQRPFDAFVLDLGFVVGWRMGRVVSEGVVDDGAMAVM